MPNRDKTGPYGTWNDCMPTDEAYFSRSGAFGRGRGRGRGGGQGQGGRGRGNMNMFYATGTPGWVRASNSAQSPQPESRNDKIAELKKQLEDLTKTQENLKKRLDGLIEE